MTRQPGPEEKDGETPDHLAVLGDIVRASVETGDLAPLQAFLEEHKIAVSADRLLEFRDLLIVRRRDLKDLEPEARSRLRLRLVEKEDPSFMSKDYRTMLSVGVIPRCRECRWFVTAPGDGSGNGDKSCVALGSKGIDRACFGFTSME